MVFLSFLVESLPGYDCYTVDREPSFRLKKSFQQVKAFRAKILLMFLCMERNSRILWNCKSSTPVEVSGGLPIFNAVLLYLLY